MNSYQPLVIKKSDPSRIEIQWADGHTTLYSAGELRGVCPCAGCVNEVTGVRMHDPRSVPDDLSHSGLRFVGNYAITLEFSDGHHTGIFPFRFLRDHDPRG
ncbi:MAG: DUF971 domain-containing protein [Planctomycetes bacterium]|nr:DUF971 domain-containing protein [Planctomycetota bacterium]